MAALEPRKFKNSIFRANDIRGIQADGLNADFAWRLGMVLAAKAEVFVIGRDGRASSEMLRDSFIQGVLQSNPRIRIIDLDIVPTPLVYFISHKEQAQCAVMITASHCPVGYNGFKILLDNQPLAGDNLQKIAEQIVELNFVEEKTIDLNVEFKNKVGVDDYIKFVTDNFFNKNLGLHAPKIKLVVDCGHGALSIIAPQVLRNCGFEVVAINNNIDGNFPSHLPDPSQPENLIQLIEAVKAENATLGLAFDGDGDRLGVVDNQGIIIWPEIYAMTLIENLQPDPEKVVYDVKNSPQLTDFIVAKKAEPIICRSGHSLIKKRMSETGASIGCESSGHMFFKLPNYQFIIDDALCSALFLLQNLIKLNKFSNTNAYFKKFMKLELTPEYSIEVDDDEKFDKINKIQDKFRDPNVIQELAVKLASDKIHLDFTDGVRLQTDYGFGIIRASNTSNNLVMRFAARDLLQIKQLRLAFDEIITMNINKIN